VRNFLYHLVTFVFVNAQLVVLDLRQGQQTNQAVLGLDWAFWLILSWGFPVALHGVQALAGRRRA
jgi:hypothetical protein